VGKEKNKRIDKHNLVLCEGEDTTQFIIRYLEYLRKTEDMFIDFQALDFGGNKELPNFLLDLPNYPDFGIVRSIIIVRDSECSYKDAVKEVQSTLIKFKYPAPSEPNKIEQDDSLRLAFSFFPSLSTADCDGTLEDLYINNLTEDGVEIVINDIRSFLDNLQAKGRKFTWFHKTILHTYFSVTNNYVSKKIGQATEAGAFNFECDEMGLLKNLMKSICM
jgi:hypothetical protein